MILPRSGHVNVKAPQTANPRFDTEWMRSLTASMGCVTPSHGVGDCLDGIRDPIAWATSRRIIELYD